MTHQQKAKNATNNVSVYIIESLVFHENEYDFNESDLKNQAVSTND